jgi:hypothetical protein
LFDGNGMHEGARFLFELHEFVAQNFLTPRENRLTNALAIDGCFRIDTRLLDHLPSAAFGDGRFRRGPSGGKPDDESEGDQKHRLLRTTWYLDFDMHQNSIAENDGKEESRGCCAQ